MINKIADEIREVRTQLGLKQREIAVLIGINSFTYANYENRRAMPPTDVYLRIMELKTKEVVRQPASFEVVDLVEMAPGPDAAA